MITITYPLWTEIINRTAIAARKESPSGHRKNLFSRAGASIPFILIYLILFYFKALTSH